MAPRPIPIGSFQHLMPTHSVPACSATAIDYVIIFIIRLLAGRIADDVSIFPVTHHPSLSQPHVGSPFEGQRLLKGKNDELARC